MLGSLQALRISNNWKHFTRHSKDPMSVCLLYCNKVYQMWTFTIISASNTTISTTQCHLGLTRQNDMVLGRIALVVSAAASQRTGSSSHPHTLWVQWPLTGYNFFYLRQSNKLSILLKEVYIPFVFCHVVKAGVSVRAECLDYGPTVS